MPKPSSVWPVVLAIIAIIIVVTGGIWHLKSSSAEKRAKAKVAAELAAKEYAKSHPPAAAATTTRVPSLETRLLSFGAETTILLKFSGRGPLVFDAQGGEVTIASLSDGKKWNDSPQKEDWGHRFKEGWYVISKKPSSTATGIKITKIW
jgi:hypothetical protein